MPCRLSLLLVLLLAAGAQAEWKAGVARVRITPEKPMWMSGYGSRDKPAEGALHDLWAKALALQDPDGNRCVLVTMDLVGIGRDLSQEVCDGLQRKYQLPRASVLLSASHTHTGPVIRGNLDTMYFLDDKQKVLVANYRDNLKHLLIQVVGQALRDLAPAKLAWGNGQAGFAVNRRNNKEPDVPKLIAEGKLKGPVDHQVPVLRVSDSKDALKAIVFGYACHATVLSFYQWSGDYPGFAQIELEKAHPGATALFWAGCGADQNPLPRRTVALAEKYGKELAASVETVLKTPLKQIRAKDSLSAVYSEIDLPLGELPSRDRLLQDAVAKDRYVAARAKALLEELKAKGALRGNYPYPVQAWQFGPDLTLVTLGGEVVVDYALRLKKELGPDNLWVMGYANDVMAYIPSLRVLKEGGYEGSGAMVYYGLPTAWSPRVEELIVKEAHALVKKIRTRPPAPRPPE